MTSPHYVVKKVGETFQPVRQGPGGMNPSEDLVDMAWMVGGAALLLKGLAHRGLLGTSLVALGGGMIYRALTGESPLNSCCGKSMPRSGPTFQHDSESLSTQRPKDEVDMASMASFPASDPPGH